jgi:hypothetical protein
VTITITIDAPITATAMCLTCRWTAQHTGPALEVATFLRTLLLAHVREAHQDATAISLEDQLWIDTSAQP